MEFVKKPQLTSLINSYQQKDYTLWQILTQLAQSNTALIDQFNRLRTAFNWEMRIYVDTVGTGIGRGIGYRVTLPRDENGNLIYTKVLPVLVHLTAKVLPSGSDFIGDLQYSLNQNDFNSIFKTTTTLVLPDDGTVEIQYGDFSTNQFIDGGLMILNVSQTGGLAGVEVTILGIMI